LTSEVGDPSCVFCRVVGGSEPASTVVSGALVVAFLDAYPVAPGHVLVVPRRHVPSVTDLTAEEGAELWATAQRVATRVKAALAPSVNLHLSDGEAAEQDVPHTHLHVIPRHPGDRVVLDLPGERVDRAELDRVAAVLAAD
jgi:histidine triad (HIT) family protein